MLREPASKAYCSGTAAFVKGSVCGPAPAGRQARSKRLRFQPASTSRKAFSREIARTESCILEVQEAASGTRVALDLASFYLVISPFQVDIQSDRQIAVSKNKVVRTVGHFGPFLKFPFHR